MSGLLEEAKDVARAVRQTKWREVETRLKPDELADLNAALLDTTISSSAIITVLKRRNIEVSRDTIAKWRQGIR